MKHIASWFVALLTLAFFFPAIALAQDQSPVELRCDEVCVLFDNDQQCGSVCGNAFGNAGGDCGLMCSDVNSCITECNRIIDTAAGGTITQSPTSTPEPSVTPQASGLIQVPRPENLPDTLATVEGLLSRIIGAALIIAAILTFLYLIWGGIQWITSGGDKQGLEDARGRITAAIVGLVVVAASWAIFQLVQQLLLGGDNAILQLIG